MFPLLSGICNAALNIVEFVIQQNALCFVSQIFFGQLQIVRCCERHYKCRSTEVSFGLKPGDVHQLPRP